LKYADRMLDISVPNPTPLAAGCTAIFVKSGNAVELVERHEDGWSVERVDTRKGMFCPADALIHVDDWRRLHPAD
jgi:hypothetical protein